MMIFKMLNSDSDFKANGEASQSNSSGKSLSEAFIFASNNPQYDNRLFIELQVQHENSKLKHGENILCTKIVSDIQNNFCSQHVLPIFFAFLIL